MPASRQISAYVAGMLLLPAAASAAHYGLKPITITGATQVNASAINNRSQITGTYNDAKGTHGFVLSGGVVTTLAVPPGCPPDGDTPCFAAPTSINATGVVVGYYYADSTDVWGFAWQAGAYLPTGWISLGNGPLAQPAVTLTNNSQISFNEYRGDFNVPFAGPIANPMPVTLLGSPAAVVSTNDFGDITGVAMGAVALVQRAHVLPIMPRGARSSAGGYLNNKREVAGTYTDHTGMTRGFVYQSGKYTSFDVPKPATGFAVQAINDAGRVIGTYVDSKTNLQKVFVYTGSAVNIVAHFPATDIVRLALNGNGTILISDRSNTNTQSYRALCAGTGC